MKVPANECAVIHVAAIQQRIEEINAQKRDIVKTRNELYFKLDSDVDYSDSVKSLSEYFTQLVIESRTLKRILSQSKELIPEIKKAFNEGAKRYCYSPKPLRTFKSSGEEKQDYISTLKIEL